MKWQSFGKESEVIIEGYRDGCGSMPCVHLRADIAMSTNEARIIIDRLLRAIKYAEGRKRKYKDHS